MNADANWQIELAAMLRGNGHSEADVAKIMERVQKYEAEMQLDSVMDSIGDGSLDLTEIIRAALRE